MSGDTGSDYISRVDTSRLDSGMRALTIGNYKYEIYPAERFSLPCSEYVILKLMDRNDGLWKVQVLDALPSAALAETECREVIRALTAEDIRTGVE